MLIVLLKGREDTLGEHTHAHHIANILRDRVKTSFTNDTPGIGYLVDEKK